MGRSLSYLKTLASESFWRQNVDKGAGLEISGLEISLFLSSGFPFARE